MSSDTFNQLTTQLTALQNKLDRKNWYLNDLLSRKIKQISYLKTADSAIAELGSLYQILNDPSYTPLFTKLKSRKAVEQINILILNIINQDLENKHHIIRKPKKKPPPVTPRSKLFISLAVLGTVLAALSGAAAIQSIFSAFISVFYVPAGLIIGAQVLFAATAVFAFYLFELNSIGKSLGIRPFDLGLIFKQYSEQEHSFKENFRLIEKEFRYCNNLDEYQQINKKYTALRAMYVSFGYKLQEAEKAKEPNHLKNIAQKILTAFGAAIFGVLAALGAQPVLVAFLPIIFGTAIATGPIGLAITAVVMSVCALAGAGLFVFMERKGERIINKLWGTPTKTIDKLLSRGEKINEIASEIEKTKTLTFSRLKHPHPSQSSAIKDSEEKNHLPSADLRLPELFYPENKRRSGVNLERLKKEHTLEQYQPEHKITVN